MLRTRCPKCGAKVKAPDKLAGKKGRCPMCNSVVPLPLDKDPALTAGPPPESKIVTSVPMGDTGEETPDVEADDAGEGGLEFNPPAVLKRHCHYLICNSKDVIARWDDDGKGWMVQVKDGFVKATNNPKQIPTMGNYVFIEIEVVSEGPHQRLAGVHGYTLPGAFALMKLSKKNDSAILEALEQSTKLNDRQRALVRQRINAKYLPSVWDDAAEF
jgi:hypothetical protein